MRSRTLVAACLVLALAACKTAKPIEQRTTQGPLAEDLWMLKVVTANGREPTFDERRHWEDDISFRIGKYLREHPEAANSLDVSTFRFVKRASVGMTQEQVLILLGPPVARTTDPAEMEKLASKYWPTVKEQAKEAWVYPLGWRLFLADGRLVDITQYLPR